MSSRIARHIAIGCVIATAAAAAPPTFDVSLDNAEAKAKKAEATVKIQVSGIQLVDPASVQEQPKAGQGHLHYRIDDGPVIATTAPKLSFHELSPGEHRFELTLAANDHKPLMPSKTLRVTVPEGHAQGSSH
jgi:hypothetical protein